MERVYIIHGWGGSSTGAWIPWLKEELEAKGVSVISPDMPNTDNPAIEEWVNFVSALVNSPDGETYFVGHSIGCQAIIRYLSDLPDGVAVGGAALVAPWSKNLTGLIESEIDVAKPWIETAINWDGAKAHAKDFVVIYSDNDPYVTIEEASEFGQNLNAKLVMDSNRGHFADDDDVTQLPVLLRELMKIVKSRNAD